MDFYRRVAKGGSAEFAGEEALPVDRLMLTLGIRRVGRARGGALDPASCAPCSSASATGSTPPPTAPAPAVRDAAAAARFEPWEPVDILSLGKLLAFGLSTNWERELLRADMTRALGPELAARLDPGYPADNPVATQEPWSGDGWR